MTRLGFTLVCGAGVVFAGCTAEAKEYPIGTPQEKNGMEIGAVYLQPIEMDPPGVMRPAAESDVHLESDIKAAKTIRMVSRKGIGSPISRSHMN
jgi:periplasmic iron binding protein